MPTIGDVTAPGMRPSAPDPAPGGGSSGAVWRRRRLGPARRPPGWRFAGDADAVVADRILDLGEPGFGEQGGEAADQLGSGAGGGRRLPSSHRGASPASASIRLAIASKRQLVALRPEPEDAAIRREADIGMMPEALAPEDVGQMHLDDRHVGGLERVVDGDRGMGQRAGVEDDAVGRLARLLDPVDELAFVVGLAEIDRQVERLRARQAALLDIGQRVIAIGRRLAHAEQVQIGSVKIKTVGKRASAAWPRLIAWAPRARRERGSARTAAPLALFADGRRVIVRAGMAGEDGMAITMYDLAGNRGEPAVQPVLLAHPDGAGA